jgi:hypothetical protein
VVFVTTLSGHVAVLSVYVVAVCTSLLPVLLCTVLDSNGHQDENSSSITETDLKKCLIYTPTEAGILYIV